MTTRKELIAALSKRYKIASRSDKGRLLDDFTAITGYHRKHAIRVLSGSSGAVKSEPKRSPYYNNQVVEPLILLWEASDRICSKRLKPMIPILLDAMERYGHLSVEPIIKSKLLKISAATIDRLLKPSRIKVDNTSRRRRVSGNAIQRVVPIRTFSDWLDPAPGFFEVDMVEHCGGPKKDGNFVHSLVLTDIASGWTECIALPMRNQVLVVQGIIKAQNQLPFKMRGIDADNESAFMNQMVFDFCNSYDLELTRSRAYKKNDQAWVEQKNGAIVRKLVGYGRLSGCAATDALAKLYHFSRLYVNFFQPSFKLKTKHRKGAYIHKTYHQPKSPYQRLLDSPDISIETKSQLQQQFLVLDPIRLLHGIRQAQNSLASYSSTNKDCNISENSLDSFLRNLESAWEKSEIRPTHQTRVKPKRWWRTRSDPFENAWPLIDGWLLIQPALTGREIMDRLNQEMPDRYPDLTPLRTLQRRLKLRRQQQIEEMLFNTKTEEPTN